MSYVINWSFRMYCTKREHLLAEYETALRAYQAAVHALSDKRDDAFKKANETAERLQEAMKISREDLERHTLVHGCGFTQGESA